MNGLFWTLLSVATACSVATMVGLLLGRWGFASNPARAIVNLLTEARGALLPFILAPMLLSLGLAEWCAIGVVAGWTQAVAVARWMLRQNSEWSPSLLGGIALGQSGASLAAESARARGAVTGTLALTVIQVVTLEALLAWAHDGVHVRDSLGGWIARGGSSSLFGWLGLTVLLLAVEALASRILQGKSPRLWSQGVRRRV